ncbi:Chromosomal replication initiator protein DnaA [Desulfurella amilsii]|uniref:Chromosomal replication initiator protein DnaA n=1 Tax=Desulfurella amilsii TaxID=1562698 RepID=A0A1X4XXU6_9BACT|nr:chromosomal replication initiator protein DnaA [Desulfurella amilsii]OSS42355.1 Chromosomal replication initiator protein DnaA [Desulfurella amilsii]
MWDLFLDSFKKKLDIDDIETISLVEANSFNSELISLTIPNEEARQLLKTKYRKEFKETIEQIFDKIPKIELIIKKELKSNLNPRYQFSNFVVGPNNQLTYAASYAVSESLGKAYNPLFIYGGVGLGKTHILHAIGNHIKEKNQKKKVLYISSEEFTNELINSIQYKKMTQFRNKFRELDCLLIDDIQFISKKERTEEEFFHTFNALYENQKQIVMTSDKPPSEIKEIEDRLKSRFNWGLIVDIQPPELETRMAIIRKKAENYNLSLSDDIVEFLAKNFETNVREIEGIIVKINAYASLFKQTINIEFVETILQDVIERKQNTLNVENIQEVVAKHFNITKDTMLSGKRDKHIILPREIAIFLSRKLTQHSLSEIKIKFNMKSHATIINSCSKIEKEIEKSSQLKETIEKIEKNIKNV